MPMLPVTLLLLAAAPATPPVLHEGLPADFKVDGKLDEWKQPPSLTLGAANQVAGDMKVASPEDLSAQVWLAISPEGLAIAGEVKDDKVQHLGKKDIHMDHLEVWLALPQPKLPPLAFVSHLGEHRVSKESDCAKVSAEDPAACKAWLKQQTTRRQLLQRDLVAQYGLFSKGVVRFGLNGTVGTATFTTFPGGYRFEASIPVGAFPRTAQAPLRDLRILVDLVDADEGGVKQETFLSSSPKRKFAEVSTFHAVALKQPLRFGQWPELLERALKTQPTASYQPGPDADALQVWVNPAQAYQSVPSAHSPDVVQVDLASVTAVEKLGDVELVSVPVEANALGTVERWLVSRKGKTILYTQNVGGDQVKVAKREPGLHLVQVYDGPLSAMGSGACGMCPMVAFQHFTLDAQGRFSKPVSLESAGGMTGNAVQWTAAPDLTRLETFDVEEGADGKPGAKRLTARHTFDAAKGRYTTETFALPEAPDVAADQP